ncbi:IS3 family transposase [Streptomyces sp. NPDC005322]|uniref:IS3 family transposase n=1 Tax=Streptomyces sp. NPDC005322 TaxID=3157032 RepID=UPI0033A671E8
MAREHLPVQPVCRVLHAAESGYYAWRDRPRSNRLVKHAWLAEAIVSIHTASRGTYGSRRVHAELGLGLRIHVSHGTVELLMQRAGLHGLPGNRRPRTKHVTPAISPMCCPCCAANWTPGSPDHHLTGPDTVLVLLDELPVTTWPLTPPPVLHHADPDIVVDLDAATRHLLALCAIAPERQGPLVTIRAEHFEQTVQRLIDRWPWKPSPRAPRRGLKPRPHGQNVLTDFGAVGEDGDTLLLVSCKSRPYTPLRRRRFPYRRKPAGHGGGAAGGCAGHGQAGLR